MLRVYPVQSERIIRLVYSILIGLTPLALCFWVYRTIGDFSQGGKGTAAEKMRALEAAGIHTVKSPADMGAAVAQVVGKKG
jgi:hypothetical protein